MKVDKVYVGIIVVLVLIVAYLLLQTNEASSEAANRQNISNTVKSIYELQYESNAEVLSVSEQDGLYKVTVRFTDFTNTQQTQDVFVTKDGVLLTDRFLVIDNYKTALASQKTFIECLQTKGLRIAGKANDTATLQQLSVLGNYAYKLFASCDGANEAACNSFGVTAYPTTVYNNTLYNNIYVPQFFSQLTGCSLQA